MRTEDSKPQAEQSQPPKHRCKQGLFQEITIACFETPAAGGDSARVTFMRCQQETTATQRLCQLQRDSG